MITSKFSKRFTQREVSLEIQESKCVLIHVVSFLGIKIKQTAEEFKTLLTAENRFDELCQHYERLGYDSTDQ